ncbi:MAG: hypothetical protein OXC26_06345 [Albidovulum sp.]|nr:hypothetical protein [Albidovulum sp.]
MKVLDNAGAEGDDIFAFELVGVSIQVAFVSHVEEMRGAEILPEPVLHPLDPVDELPDLEDAKTSGVQDGFLLDGIGALFGALAVTGGLGPSSAASRRT